MALHWDLKDIRDYETACFVMGEDGKRRLSPVTEALIWYTMAVDIGRLTEADLPEFWARMKVADALRGPMLWDIDEYRPITLDELKAHVGLSTNVAKVPRASWVKRVVTEGRMRDYVAEAVL